MNPILRNILVCLGGVVLGSAANMAIVLLSFVIVDMPAGIDIKDPDTFAMYSDQIPTLGFILALLAHGFGTFVAAWIICKFVTGHQKKFAIGVGIFFLLGGIMNLQSLPSPAWFPYVDLTLCYIPAALLGYVVAGGEKKEGIS